MAGIRSTSPGRPAFLETPVGRTMLFPSRRELLLAGQVQRGIMPAIPAAPGYEFFAHYQPVYPVGGDYYQWPDTELELQGFLTYPLVMASHSTDCTGTWRSAGCLTNGRRIPISLCGNSTSSTVLVRPVGG